MCDSLQQESCFSNKNTTDNKEHASFLPITHGSFFSCGTTSHFLPKCKGVCSCFCRLTNFCLRQFLILQTNKKVVSNPKVRLACLNCLFFNFKAWLDLAGFVDEDWNVNDLCIKCFFSFHFCLCVWGVYVCMYWCCGCYYFAALF